MGLLWVVQQQSRVVPARAVRLGEDLVLRRGGELRERAGEAVDDLLLCQLVGLTLDPCDRVDECGGVHRSLPLRESFGSAGVGRVAGYGAAGGARRSASDGDAPGGGRPDPVLHGAATERTTSTGRRSGHGGRTGYRRLVPGVPSGAGRVRMAVRTRPAAGRRAEGGEVDNVWRGGVRIPPSRRAPVVGGCPGACGRAWVRSHPWAASTASLPGSSPEATTASRSGLHSAMSRSARSAPRDR